MKNKRRIGFDWDDTSIDFHTPLKNYHNETYGTSLKLEDFTSYLFNRVWGGTIEEAVRKIKDFHLSDYSKEIILIPYALEAIDILSKKNELVIVTSRPDFIREKTKRDIEEFFRNKFSGVYFSSNFYSRSVGKTKAQICKELGLYAIIDDSLDYIKQCSPVVEKAILFGDYPWNQNGKLPENAIRCVNWKEVLEQLT